MIQALKELGEQKLKLDGRKVTDLLSILVQDPNQNENYPYALVVVFEKTESGFQYRYIEVEQASKDKVRKYLYRRKSPQGADFTPTAKITDDLGKTFKNKVQNWFKKTEMENPLMKTFKKF